MSQPSTLALLNTGCNGLAGSTPQEWQGPIEEGTGLKTGGAATDGFTLPVIGHLRQYSGVNYLRNRRGAFEQSLRIRCDSYRKGQKGDSAYIGKDTRIVWFMDLLCEGDIEDGVVDCSPSCSAVCSIQAALP